LPPSPSTRVTEEFPFLSFLTVEPYDRWRLFRPQRGTQQFLLASLSTCMGLREPVQAASRRVLFLVFFLFTAPVSFSYVIFDVAPAPWGCFACHSLCGAGLVFFGRAFCVSFVSQGLVALPPVLLREKRASASRPCRAG